MSFDRAAQGRFIALQGAGPYLEGVTDPRSISALMRLFLALLLATIGLQAVPAGNIPIERDHGSAFSASSLDTAVARQVDRIETQVVAQPLPPPPGDTDARSLPAEARDSDHDWHVGPLPRLPALALAASPYLPRPPPRA